MIYLFNMVIFHRYVKQGSLTTLVHRADEKLGNLVVLQLLNVR